MRDPELGAPQPQQAADIAEGGWSIASAALGVQIGPGFASFGEAGSQRLAAKLSRNISCIRLGGINLKSLAVFGDPGNRNYRSVSRLTLSYPLPGYPTISQFGVGLSPHCGDPESQPLNDLAIRG